MGCGPSPMGRPRGRGLGAGMRALREAAWGDQSPQQKRTTPPAGLSGRREGAVCKTKRASASATKRGALTLDLWPPDCEAVNSCYFKLLSLW